MSVLVPYGPLHAVSANPVCCGTFAVIGAWSFGCWVSLVSRLRLRGGTRPAQSTMIGFLATIVVLCLGYWTVDTPTPALPEIRDDLGLSATVTGMIFSVFFFGRLVANLPAAWVVDQRGPKVTICVGALLVITGSLVSAFSSSAVPLLAARAVQGMGVAFLAPAGLLSLLRVRPAGGAAMASFNVAAGVGGAIGLLIGGLLTGAFGWRSVFLQTAAIGVVILLVGVFARQRSLEMRPEAAGTDQPLRESNVPKTRINGLLLLAMAANFLVFLNYCIWAVGAPLYAAEVVGASPEVLGQLLMVITVVHLLGAFPMGRLVGAIGPYPVFGIGMVLTAVGVFTAIFMQSAWGMILPLALYAAGASAANIASGDLLLRLGGAGGKAVGMVRLTSDFGMVLGPIFAGILADRFGVRAPFVAVGSLSVVAAIAVAIVLLVVRRRLARI